MLGTVVAVFHQHVLYVRVRSSMMVPVDSSSPSRARVEGNWRSTVASRRNEAFRAARHDIGGSCGGQRSSDHRRTLLLSSDAKGGGRKRAARLSHRPKRSLKGLQGVTLESSIKYFDIGNLRSACVPLPWRVANAKAFQGRMRWGLQEECDAVEIGSRSKFSSRSMGEKKQEST